MQALQHGAGEGDRLKKAAFGMIRRQGDGDVDGKANDAAGHVFAHVLFDADGHAFHGQVFLFGFDANDGGHASRQSCGDEVGR